MRVINSITKIVAITLIVCLAVAVIPVTSEAQADAFIQSDEYPMRYESADGRERRDHDFIYVKLGD